MENGPIVTRSLRKERAASETLECSSVEQGEHTMLRYNKWMRTVSIVSVVAVFVFVLSLFGSAEADTNLTQGTINTTVNEDTTSLGGCPWDLNRDGTVDSTDQEILFFCWGTCCGVCCRADFDSDGVVSTSDLLDLLFNWGSCP